MCFRLCLVKQSNIHISLIYLVFFFSWSLLKLYTSGEYDDHLQAQAAGLAEGFITAEQISMHWQNTMAGYCDNEKEFCDKVHKFLSDMDEWIQSQIKENPNDPYWYQVTMIF